MNILDTFLISLFYLKLRVMHHDFVARMGIKVAKASAYQNHGLMMARKTVMMVQMKKVGVFIKSFGMPIHLTALSRTLQPTHTCQITVQQKLLQSFYL